MLQVRRLEKIIDNRIALSIEELDVNPGDVVTVVGQIGSGKTLLIRLLCGMLVPNRNRLLSSLPSRNVAWPSLVP